MEVATVVDYVNQQCAFQVSPLDVETMLHQEIQWQLRNTIESHDDIKSMARGGQQTGPGGAAWPGDELVA